MIDLRSDTVTRPTEAMHKAMMAAEVGDDVYGEDPAINALQEEGAALLGMEAALFVPTGTMANQLALKAHTHMGDEVVVHPNAHIVRAESGAGAALAGVQFRMAGREDGTLDRAAVADAIQDGSNPHFAPTRLICCENTHNFQGGTVWPLEELDALGALAAERGVPLHLDGARLLNACVKQDVKPERILRHFASTTLCLSKGLGAPVGSLVAGSKDFIATCLRYRKMYGGGMRQAGYLAEAARYALKHHVQRLAEDHENATVLAGRLAQNKHIQLMYGMPETNIVFFRLEHPKLSVADLVAQLKARGVMIGGSGAYAARAVTHLDVTRAQVEQAADAFDEILG